MKVTGNLVSLVIRVFSECCKEMSVFYVLAQTAIRLEFDKDKLIVLIKENKHVCCNRYYFTE